MSDQLFNELTAIARAGAQRVMMLEALRLAATALESVIRNRPQAEGAPTNIALDVIAKRARAVIAEVEQA